MGRRQAEREDGCGREGAHGGKEGIGKKVVIREKWAPGMRWAWGEGGYGEKAHMVGKGGHRGRRWAWGDDAYGGKVHMGGKEGMGEEVGMGRR